MDLAILQAIPFLQGKMEFLSMLDLSALMAYWPRLTLWSNYIWHETKKGQTEDGAAGWTTEEAHDECKQENL